MENKKSGKLSLATILSYGMAYGSGYQIMGSLVGSYLMIFFTDTFGIPAAAAGVIMVLASIWDAINDPIMGVLADKTHTRFGKFRPYLLWVPGCLTVAVVCLFMSPNLSSTGKIIWAAVFSQTAAVINTVVLRMRIPGNECASFPNFSRHSCGRSANHSPNHFERTPEYQSFLDHRSLGQSQMLRHKTSFLPGSLAFILAAERSFVNLIATFVKVNV